MIFQIGSYEERYILDKNTTTKQFKLDCEKAYRMFFKKNKKYDSPWIDANDLVQILCKNFGYSEIRAKQKNCVFAPDFRNPFSKENIEDD